MDEILGEPKPKFMTKKWIEVFDQSGGECNVNKDIRFKTLQLRSDLCDFNDAYIVVTGKSTVTNPDDAYDKKLTLRNNALFHSCVERINRKLIEDAQDLDAVMPMYNLINYSKNHQKLQDLWGIIIEMNQILVQKEIITIQVKTRSHLTIKQILLEN